MNEKKITLIEDTRQQADKHIEKHLIWEQMNINIVRSKLPCGDYADIHNMSVVVDTKKDIQEIIGNVTKQHDRFRAECELAQNSDIQLIILIENKSHVECIDDLKKWYNYRLKKNRYATTGRQLAKILTTMQEKYGVLFYFCSKEEAATKVLDLLNIDY